MTEKQTTTGRNSTVAISPDVAKKLDKFCQSNGMTKKDFISLSLSYFEKQGINPAKHESPKGEIEKVTKRLDQFFAFFKKQEQDIIKPFYMDYSRTTRVIYNSFDDEAEKIRELETKVGELSKKLEEGEKRRVQEANQRAEDTLQLKEGLTNLLNLMDAKNKSGLMGKLFG